MARIRKTVTPTVNSRLSTKVMASPSNPRAVTNDAGGLNFASTDAAQRLLNQIGVPGFNEPTYYGGQSDKELKDRNSLSTLAQAIIGNAEALAQSKEPQLLLSLAWWSRDAAKCRTTPVVLLAVAAHFPATRKFLRKYAPKICTRADQIKEFWAIYDFLYNTNGSRKFNITMKRAVNDLFGNFGEVDFMKYDNKTFPTFGDILKMTDYGMGCLPKGIKDYLVYDVVTDANATPLIAARVALNKSTEFDEAAKRNAIKSRVNWEVLVSQFGNSKAVWEFLLGNNLVGYMATLRNLRNILNARIEDSFIDNVAKRLINGAVESKQMPSAFYAASQAVEQGFAYGRADTTKTWNPEGKHVRKIQDALNKAIETVRANMPKTGGTTAVFIDNSGSMGQAISHMSQITNAQAAAMLGLMAAGLSDDTLFFAFTDKPYEVKWRPGENNISLGERIMNAAGDGGSTNAWTCPRLLADKKILVDRMILISDMQCYNSHAGYGRTSQDFAGEFQNYRDKVNKDCWLYTIDVRGNAQGSSTVDDRTKNVSCLSGHSEKALELAILSETGGFVKDKATGETKVVEPMAPLDLIRTQYTLVKN